MGLFSKKPGGTFFGNLLRGVASSATGGILGNGANRIEVGQTKTNAELGLIQPANFGGLFGSMFGSSATVDSSGNIISSGKSPNWGFIAAIVGIAVGVKVLFFDKKKKRRF